MTALAVDNLHRTRCYSVRHRTLYRYDQVVTTSFTRAVLRPRATGTQRVLEHQVSISPEPDVLDETIDAFGNASHYIEIHTPHTCFEVSKSSVVEVTWPAIDLDALDAWTIDQAASTLRAKADPVAGATYTLPSPMVQLPAAVRDFAHDMLTRQMGLGTAIRTVHEQIHHEFAYRPGSTSVNTTLPELLDARSGVCQDFAHLAVACLRTMGLPARYVSGYLETTPPPGRAKLEGSDATHAWASVMAPDGDWVDLDPTNDQLADSRYIVTAWGRDFSDVSPLKGVIFTDGGESTLEVAVDVDPLPS
ncbi:transglutaminase family protein [Propionibacterium sp.]|uniref:transglutaminase family protein n=1 Tax=Propionibacterium sp. TaxID=1977903 RepID=UPI0039E83BAF